MKFPNLDLFTFCLIVSWVFVIETITGSHIITFCPRISNRVSDLRKMYRADCQTMVSSTFRDVKRASWMSRNNLGSSPWNNFWQQNIKFQNICDYQFYWSLCHKILHTGFNLGYFKISQQIFFWKWWNWERMQRMNSIAVLNGHSGKPTWKFIQFWSTGMPGTHYPIT